MAENSKIEWCDHTQNFWIGCSKVSPACDGCYAEVSTPSRTMKVGWGPGVPRHRTAPSTWAMPKKWNDQHEAFFAKHGRRQRVFSLSLGDWLDNEVPIAWLVDMLEVMRTTPNLDWLLLTKRIGMWRKRLEAAAQALAQGNTEGVGPLRDWIAAWLNGDAPANVWVGATIVNREEMLRDAPKLKATPAVVHFWSVEPLLGGLGDIPRELLPDWVIVGGESGPGARPMHPDWARSLRDQCQAAGVAFLFKQWGEWIEPDVYGNNARLTVREGDPEFESAAASMDGFLCADGRFASTLGEMADDTRYLGLVRVGKKAAGRLLDGRTWDEVPA